MELAACGQLCADRAVEALLKFNLYLSCDCIGLYSTNMLMPSRDTERHTPALKLPTARCRCC